MKKERVPLGWLAALLIFADWLVGLFLLFFFLDSVQEFSQFVTALLSVSRDLNNIETVLDWTITPNLIIGGVIMSVYVLLIIVVLQQLQKRGY